MSAEPVQTLQAQLDAAPDGNDPHGADAEPSVADPVGLFHQLEASGRFHRDTGFGRMFHPGRISFRENRPTDSLHVIVDGDHLAAHVDRVSPLGPRNEGPSRYSVRQTAAHNVAGMVEDLVRLLRGRQGDHRSELDCRWLWDESQALTEAQELLPPKTSAWSLQIEAQVTGELDEGRLRDALTAVFRGELPHTDPLTIVHCSDSIAIDEARRELQSTPVEVTAWPPLRATLAHGPGGDVVMLNVNHAACDGTDGLHLLRAVARAYATGAAPDPPLDFPSACPLPVRPASTRVSTAKARARAGVERLRDLLARPAQLAREGEEDDPRFGFHTVCLSVEETRRVVNPERPGTSRNMLLAGLHRAIGEWNLRHGTPGRRVGVLVPVNLRPPEWPSERVGNFSVTARVSTSRRHRANGAAALKAVTAQTTRNKRTRTGIALLAALERNGLIPLWSKQSLVVLQPLTQNRHVDTALLANLGELDEVPSFGEEAGETVHLWFSPPARAPLTLCVGAATLSGRLHLVLRYPRRLFSADAARVFGQCLVSEIAKVAESRSA